jgi:hypothetical protein
MDYYFIYFVIIEFHFFMKVLIIIFMLMLLFDFLVVNFHVSICTTFFVIPALVYIILFLTIREINMSNFALLSPN